MGSLPCAMRVGATQTSTFILIIIRQDPEIQAESPLMIHGYFSQTPDVSDKYILVLFLIGKSNCSYGFERKR